VVYAEAVAKMSHNSHMSASDNLSGEQFVSLSHKEGKRLHHITAHDQEGHIVGTMDWNKQSKRVFDISVHPDKQRQGIASHMWDLAHQVSAEMGKPGPKHSPNRTGMGDMWAKSVGGELPPNKGVH